jgi:hypothetical protein
MSSPNVPFFVKVTTDLLVGYEINKDGPTGVVANATLAVSIGQAIVTSGGDPMAALTAVETALAASTTDPAKQAALTTLIAFVGSKAAALEGLISGSLTATIIEQQLVAAATEAVTVAQKYLPKAA